MNANTEFSAFDNLKSLYNSQWDWEDRLAKFGDESTPEEIDEAEEEIADLEDEICELEHQLIAAVGMTSFMKVMLDFFTQRSIQERANAEFGC